MKRLLLALLFLMAHATPSLAHPMARATMAHAPSLAHATRQIRCDTACHQAFVFVVKHEDANLTGVVTPEPYGGFARFGINSRAHPEAIRAGFYIMPRSLALRYAERMFYRDYWLAMHADDMQDRRYANKIVDLAYNIGVGRATRLVAQVHNMASVDAPETELVLLKWRARLFYTRLAQRHSELRAWKHVWLARTEEG